MKKFHDKLKYMEDINSVTSMLIDSITEQLTLTIGSDFVLKQEDEDKLWDYIQTMLTEYSETGDYKNHN
jgi:hypothetical protein